MVEKRVKKFGQGSPLPLFRAMPERKYFFAGGVPINTSTTTITIIINLQAVLERRRLDHNNCRRQIKTQTKNISLPIRKGLLLASTANVAQRGVDEK